MNKLYVLSIVGIVVALSSTVALLNYGPYGPFTVPYEAYCEIVVFLNNSTMNGMTAFSGDEAFRQYFNETVEEIDVQFDKLNLTVARWGVYAAETFSPHPAADSMVIGIMWREALELDEQKPIVEAIVDILKQKWFTEDVGYSIICAD